MNKGRSFTRQSGGMRQSFGGMSTFDSEKMEQQAIQGATQQKAVAQQSGNTGTKRDPTSQQHQSSSVSPREVGSFVDELVKRPSHDVATEVMNFFDINALLGINTDDTPEEKNKKTQLHQRYQRLTQEEQQVAQRKYQEKLQKKQEEEKIQQQQEQEEKQKEATALPSVGKVNKRGTALMGGSQKKKAAARLAHDRQRMGKIAGAN